ncbi:MAG: response regulator, partial [Gemmatimonadota bacterium]|nr:response regulator [Gemmatimonadota bacterium]
LDELDEQLAVLNTDLLALETQPTDAERLKSVFRVAHTLKGAAGAAGVQAIAKACHAMEETLAAARDGRLALAAPNFAALFAAADALAGAGKLLRGGAEPSSIDLSAMTRLFRPSAAAAPQRPLPSGPARPEVPPPKAAAVEPAAPPVQTVAAMPEPAPQLDGTIRVRSEKLDDLVATAGQSMIVAARNAESPDSIDALREQASRWAAEWRPAARAIRVALERAGAGGAIAEPLSAIERNLAQLVRDTTAMSQSMTRDSLSLVRLAADMMHRARSLRMRPFSELGELLPRIVRDLAAATGKEVQVDIVGGDVEADRMVLDGFRDAVMHLIRNAVDHGIETPAERERKGKPSTGTVTVAAALRGEQIVVTVSDDGNGLDTAAIRKRLKSTGVPVPDDEQGLARALFEEGFTTRQEANAISGRGVGLGIVRAAVERIRGDVEVTWTPGKGTTFTMSAPLTLATTRAVLVEVGTHTLAIPTDAIERLLRLAPSEVRSIEGRHALVTPEGPVPLVTLARILGPPVTERPQTGLLRAILLSVGRRRLALVVDDLTDETELVVRPLERRDPRAMPHLSGAALLPSGRVALVLNPMTVISSGLSRADRSSLAMPAAEAPVAARRRVLVADDSITTRTLEQSVLDAAGYDVFTAVDGLDAWRLLQERGADLVVSDVEMPRLDGFALCERMRASKQFKELPVILVTSLESPEDRARGLEAGADAYIVKSSFDQQALLDTIHQLIG